MKISLDMLTSVEAIEETTMSTLKTGISARVIGSTLIVRMLPPTSVVPKPYHSLGLPAVSTTGAHSIFHVCGQTESAIKAPIMAVGTPARASRKPSVTVT